MRRSPGPGEQSPDPGLKRGTFRLLAEPLSVLDGRDEGLDHLGPPEVAAELVQLIEPELEARLVRVASQVAEVLAEHEAPVELAGGEGRVLDHRAERLSP